MGGRPAGQGPTGISGRDGPAPGEWQQRRQPWTRSFNLFSIPVTRGPVLASQHPYGPLTWAPSLALCSVCGLVGSAQCLSFPLSPVHSFWTQPVWPAPESITHAHRLSFLTREQQDQSNLESFEKMGLCHGGRVAAPSCPASPPPPRANTPLTCMPHTRTPMTADVLCWHLRIWLAAFSSEASSPCWRVPILRSRTQGTS